MEMSSPSRQLAAQVFVRTDHSDTSTQREEICEAFGPSLEFKADALGGKSNRLEMAGLIPQEIYFQAIGSSSGTLREPFDAILKNSLGHCPRHFRILIFTRARIFLPDVRHDLKPADLAAVSSQLIAGATMGLGRAGFEHGEGIAQRHARCFPLRGCDKNDTDN